MKSRGKGRAKFKGRLVEVSGQPDAVARVIEKLSGVTRVELEREADGRHIADIPSVPGAMAYGESPGQAVDRAVSIAQVAVNGEAPPEQVNHPAHYGGSDDPYEAIKVIEAWGAGFNVGSALKYLRRAGVKSPSEHAVDLEKAAWYLNREALLLRGHRPAETVRDEVRTVIPTLQTRLRERRDRINNLELELISARAELDRTKALLPKPRRGKRAKKGARR